MNYPRRHNRANTAVTHEKSKYDMTSLYRQPMVVVLSISLDTFYSNKNYATRKI